MDVPVIADRNSSYEPTPPDERIFDLFAFARTFEPLKPTRMYTGDKFRVAVFRMKPGQEQSVHRHPETTHAWFVFEGTAEITTEAGTERAGRGTFCVHPQMTIHGLRNVGEDDLVYITLSIGR